MKCRECFQFIIDYVENDLTAEVRTTFEQHLADCQPCLDYLESYRLSIKIGQQVCCNTESEALEEMPSALIALILAAKKKSE